MTFKPYHYHHVNDFLRYYASSMGRADIIAILDRGISTEQDAKVFAILCLCYLISVWLTKKSAKNVPVENGSAMIADLHYEAGSFVCDAGFEAIWDAMINAL